METRTEYEKMLLKEVREMPCEVLPQVVKIIHSLKEGVLSVKVRHKKGEARESGLCGIWEDERSAAEIIKDIRTNATLATNNEKHFERIKGLKVQNWVL